MSDIIERLREELVVAERVGGKLMEEREQLGHEIDRLRGLLQWWIDAGPDADWDDYEQRVCEAIRNAR